VSDPTTDETPFEKICSTSDALETDEERHVMVVLNRSLLEAVRAAQRSGKKAKVTLAIEIKANGEGRVSAAMVVNATLPRPPANSAQLFADGMGNLHGSDPRQLPLSMSTRHNPKEN
jgi:hypothetical protein